MSEPSPWVIVSALLTIGAVATFILNEFSWRNEADKIFCNNEVLKSIGGFDTLGLKSRQNLVGLSDVFSDKVTEAVLVPHLRKHGFREPKGGCGWLDDPSRNDLAGFDTCYMNEVIVKNCKLFYMVAAKFGDAKEATKLVGSHFQITPCFSTITEEKLCSL